MRDLRTDRATQDPSARRISSFDVFDTLLTRRTGSPKTAFLMLGNRLERAGIITGSAAAFARQRHAAEARAFGNSGGLDSATNLRSIYDELAMAIGLTDAQVNNAMAVEIQLEHELLTTVSTGVAKLDEARERGDEIVFVSDMYLPHDQLRVLLENNKLYEPGDRLFVSNELRASKASGAIWQPILNELGATANEITHLGNDLTSDYRKAKKAGLEAQHFPEGNLNRYEEALEAHALDTDGVASLLAGSSRLARLNEVPASQSALRDVASGVVAPFVIGFVLWTLRRAKDDGVAKVYFVARDGRLLVDVAKVLAPKVGYTGELHYLYGSRQAWMLPSLTKVTAASIESISPSEGDVDLVTVRTILHRLGIEPEDSAELLTASGFAANSWDTPMGAAECEQLRTAVLANEQLHDKLIALAADQRAEFVEYLDQMGAITDEPIALVDLGTGATLHNYLAQVLDAVGQAPPKSYYFGLRREAADVGFGLPETYVRNEISGTGLLHTPGWLTMVEMSCTAEHGSVTGYHREGDVVVPTIAATSNTRVVDWGLSEVQEAVVEVAETLRFDDGVDPLHVDLRPAAFAAFQAFWEHPSTAEAQRWGSYPFEDGWGSDSVHLTLAEPQGVSAALKSQPHRHWWNAGARALSAPVPRAMLRARQEALGVYRKLR